MKTTTLLLVSIASLALSAPTKSLLGEVSEWSPELAAFYSTVDKHVQEVRSTANYGSSPTCDLSAAQMPQAPTPLPLPDPGLSLRHVAIGRGIQVGGRHSMRLTISNVV